MLKYLTSASITFCLLSSPLFAMEDGDKGAKQLSKTLSVSVDNIQAASSASKSKHPLGALSDPLQRAVLLYLGPKGSCKAARASKGIYKLILADDFWYQMGTQQIRVFRSLPLEQRAAYSKRLKGEFGLRFPIAPETSHRNAFVWYSARSKGTRGTLNYRLLKGYGRSIGFALDLGVQIGDYDAVLNKISADLDNGGRKLPHFNISMDTLQCIIESNNDTFVKKALRVGAHLSGASRSKFLEPYASKGKSKIALFAGFQLALDMRKSGKLKEAEDKILELCDLGSYDAIVLHLGCLHGEEGYRDLFKEDEAAFKSAIAKYKQTYENIEDNWRYGFFALKRVR